MIFYVSGQNQLSIQLTATSLVPPPPLQYIAIGFSHDSLMVNFNLKITILVLMINFIIKKLVEIHCIRILFNIQTKSSILKLL
jgi:hypothetical protein